jgi:putative ABC transport system ATP-binding protein
MKPIIIRDLNHYFGEKSLAKQALFDINLEIEAGEIVIMTGPSGSGKTTLLTLLGGLRSVESGSLQTLGQELFSATEADLVKLRRKIGYIFQAHNLLPFMTAQQNVQMSLELEANLSGRKAASRAAEMLAQVGLKDRIKYYPKSLSGGQKQRVAIARALANHPKLVLADEPTAALDSKTGREVINLMHKLVKENHSTILLVTHDNRILDIADRIIYMEDGRLVDSETKSSQDKFLTASEANVINSLNFNSSLVHDNFEEELIPLTTNNHVPEIVTVNKQINNNRPLTHPNNDSVVLNPQSFNNKEFKVSQNQSSIDLTITPIIDDDPSRNLVQYRQQPDATNLINLDSSKYRNNNYHQATNNTNKENYTVICIDDSITILKAIETFLEDDIFKVITIQDPVKALTETVRNRPDIILLDVTMPKIDGYEFCSLLRQHQLFKNTPIIIVTSKKDSFNRNKAKLVGASDYLTKPFDRTDLLKILFKYLF